MRRELARASIPRPSRDPRRRSPRGPAGSRARRSPAAPRAWLANVSAVARLLPPESRTAGTGPSRDRCAVRRRAAGRRGSSGRTARSRRCAAWSGTNGGRPQFCPLVLNSSGGAPTLMPCASTSWNAHASAPSASNPIGRSCMTGSARRRARQLPIDLDTAATRETGCGRGSGAARGSPRHGRRRGMAEFRRPCRASRRRSARRARRRSRTRAAPPCSRTERFEAGRPSVRGPTSRSASSARDLQPEDLVAVDQPIPIERSALRGESRTMASVSRARDLLDAQVQRTAETAARRESTGSACCGTSAPARPAG